MRYTSEQFERARAALLDSEQRLVRQRRRVEKLTLDRQPAEQAQALLKVMEETVLSMKRYLEILEKDLGAGI